MKISGCIRTTHQAPAYVAAAVAADNLRDMETVAEEYKGTGVVITTITSTRIRSVIASVDDYLANITVAEELCSEVLTGTGQKTESKRLDMLS
jgi:2-succinyl-5-enolpyruvyl-6-hydroxy-3-cyclohexene-1-carboxylate synthase